MLLMACYAGLAGLHAVPTDLRVVHGVYPLPANSLTALAAIFPKARSDMQKRYCLRLLQKTLKPGVLDVAMIVALLCFGQKSKAANYSTCTRKASSVCGSAHLHVEMYSEFSILHIRNVDRANVRLPCGCLCSVKSCAGSAHESHGCGMITVRLV